MLEYLLYIIGGVELATLAVALPKHCATLTSEWSQPQRWRLETRGAHSRILCLEESTSQVSVPRQEVSRPASYTVVSFVVCSLRD
jgi:hypothetical protein